MGGLKGRADIDVLTSGLATIAAESRDSDSVRVALVALYETDWGRAYLAANPLKF